MASNGESDDLLKHLERPRPSADPSVTWVDALTAEGMDPAAATLLAGSASAEALPHLVDLLRSTRRERDEARDLSRQLRDDFRTAEAEIERRIQEAAELARQREPPPPVDELKARLAELEARLEEERIGALKALDTRASEARAEAATGLRIEWEARLEGLRREHSDALSAIRRQQVADLALLHKAHEAAIAELGSEQDATLRRASEERWARMQQLQDELRGHYESRLAEGQASAAKSREEAERAHAEALRAQADTLESEKAQELKALLAAEQARLERLGRQHAQAIEHLTGEQGKEIAMLRRTHEDMLASKEKDRAALEASLVEFKGKFERQARANAMMREAMIAERERLEKAVHAASTSTPGTPSGPSSLPTPPSTPPAGPPAAPAPRAAPRSAPAPATAPPPPQPPRPSAPPLAVAPLTAAAIPAPAPPASRSPTTVAPPTTMAPPTAGAPAAPVARAGPVAPAPPPAPAVAAARSTKSSETLRPGALPALAPVAAKRPDEAAARPARPREPPAVTPPPAAATDAAVAADPADEATARPARPRETPTAVAPLPPSWLPAPPILYGGAIAFAVVILAIGLMVSRSRRAVPEGTSPAPVAASAPLASTATEALAPAPTPPPVAAPVSNETGWADILSTPSGGAVKLAGTEVGQTPLGNLQVRVGTYAVEITLAGHQRWQGSLAVEAGKKAEIRAQLTRLTVAGAQPTRP